MVASIEQNVRRLLLAALCSVALSACGGEQKAPALRETTEPEAAEEIKNIPGLDPYTVPRIQDLVMLHDALEAYHSKNGQYPKTPNGDLVSVVTAPEGNWIPGLAPDFIASLPRDPARSTDAKAPQYMYASSGGSYKLIAHGVSGGCDPRVEIKGVRRDPARINPDGTCWAFGFWSDGMEKY